MSIENIKTSDKNELGIDLELKISEPNYNNKLGIKTDLDIPFSSDEVNNDLNDEVEIEDIVPGAFNEEVIAKHIPVKETPLDLSGYAQRIRSKVQASDYVKETNGVITTGNQKYIILPDENYTGRKGTISESDYELLIPVIAGEGGNDIDDMLGVACTVLNRLEDGIRGNTINEILEDAYFPFGRSYERYIPGGKFYDTEAGQIKLANAKKVLDDALMGVRNTASNVYYYYGDGEHNYFSDNV